MLSLSVHLFTASHLFSYPFRSFSRFDNSTYVRFALCRSRPDSFSCCFTLSFFCTVIIPIVLTEQKFCHQFFGRSNEGPDDQTDQQGDDGKPPEISRALSRGLSQGGSQSNLGEGSRHKLADQPSRAQLSSTDKDGGTPSASPAGSPSKDLKEKSRTGTKADEKEAKEKQGGGDKDSKEQQKPEEKKGLGKVEDAGTAAGGDEKKDEKKEDDEKRRKSSASDIVTEEPKPGVCLCVFVSKFVSVIVCVCVLLYCMCSSACALQSE